MRRVEGKHILVTGASQGLGRQLALDFAREGAAGLALVARHGDLLHKVREDIRDLSPTTRVLALAADLGDEDAVERVAAATLGEFRGRVDVLVNNASALGPSPMPLLLDYPAEDFRNVLNVNLVAPFLLIRKVLPAMLESGGSILNVTSDAGRVGYPQWGAYGISKFGLEGLSQTWAAETAETGVRVNWVDPGNMNTAMHRAAEPEADPGQWADPAQVTEVFLFLASDASRGVTGMRLVAQEDWQAQVVHAAQERG